MGFLGRAAAYDRTCTDCGYGWRVPRAFARRKWHALSSLSPAGGLNGYTDAELNAAIQSSMAINRQAETFRRCPKCGSERHSQRPARS